jgi:hypothetical protein
MDALHRSRRISSRCAICTGYVVSQGPEQGKAVELGTVDEGDGGEL